MLKSQSSMEMVMILTFITAVFVVFLAVAGQKVVETQQQKEMQAAAGLKEVIASEVAAASAAEEGYSRTFELPLNLNSQPYNLTLIAVESAEHSEIWIDYNQGREVLNLAKNIKGNPCPGENRITNDRGLRLQCLD